jgi:pyruvate formate lyase activating enzyme
MPSRPAEYSPLATTLRRHTAPGTLCEPIPGKESWIHCHACGHDCRIPPGQEGICKVRFNEAGTLQVPWGYVSGLQCDPIEKKPFFHVLPGREALSFGMLGCDYHCSYCQNWFTSQALRDEDAVAPITQVKVDDLMDLAGRQQAVAMISTYNEPLITAEWAVAIFKKAQEQGLLTGFVSNGNATEQALDFLRPHTDLFKIDLKSLNPARYRELGGVLERVLETIQGAFQRGFWVEVVTLVVPGFNDSPQELRGIARFLASVSADIPWHVTAFHPNYRMNDPAATPGSTLAAAVTMGRDEGLNYVYAGNLPGQVDGAEDTICPHCKGVLVQRRGYTILATRLDGSSCPDCHTPIPGVWETPPATGR